MCGLIGVRVKRCADVEVCGLIGVQVFSFCGSFVVLFCFFWLC